MAIQLFLLGADDPEMQAVERLLAQNGIPFAYATVGGVRATPGNSYRIDPVTVPNECELVVIECAFHGMPSSTTTIDHHREGDPGFALGPDRFWEASSIGQLHALLGLAPGPDARVVAAFDHCFAAAACGMCEGVEPEEIIHMRVSEMSKETGRLGSDIWASVNDFRCAFTAAPEVMIGNQRVKDFRHQHLGKGYSFEYLAAQFAAAMGGFAVLLRHGDHVRSAEKYTLTGYAEKRTIIAFMESWGPEQGLVRIFGVPQRGYAGGFISR